MSCDRAHRPLTPALLLLIVLALCCGACGGGSGATNRTRGDAVSETGASNTHGHLRGDWLGLNYNSSANVGGLQDFSSVGVVWDRLGSLEPSAGETVSSSQMLADGLARSVGAGMVPDIQIDTASGPHGCTTNPTTSGLCLPQTPAQISAYVDGFIATASSIRAAYPHTPIVFEPANEPWNWGYPPGLEPGRQSAGEYAALLARLLPAAKAAGIPLDRVYVPARGELDDHTQWITDLYASEPCLQPGPRSCGPIGGWNVHPYGPPDSSELGIASVPPLRRLMASGSDNIIVSEMGFCSLDVEAGADCEKNTATVDGSSEQTASWLTTALQLADRMHEAGWLKALIVWERLGGGWSMQLRSGALTAQGQALVQFARSH